ncbi:hypothetical protein [Hyphomicrobium sp. ghe19]|uniref:hypothetical protein n=1 Tax=Hyphomicrobium sp. ghe19 TaxID=2682968 RepID=UPI0013678411|nr:hypothetical protein HYPP_02338 [Hyphomicrobium sp. ghe19]
MQRNPDAPSDFTVAFATFIGFFAVTIFAAGIGSYIGRHSTPEPSQAAAAPAPASLPAQASPSKTP